MPRRLSFHTQLSYHLQTDARVQTIIMKMWILDSPIHRHHNLLQEWFLQIWEQDMLIKTMVVYVYKRSHLHRLVV
jgi:hypothetical protein